MNSPIDPSARTEMLTETPPHGMKGDLSQSFAWDINILLMALLAILILTALVASVIGYKIWRSRKKPIRQTRLTSRFDPSAWDLLLQDIAAIVPPSEQLNNLDAEISAALSHRRIQFSNEVSLCLRRGLEIKTGIPFAERTNEEIFRLFETSQVNLPNLSLETVRQILLRLDQVRFGGQPMNSLESQVILDSLTSWCRETQHQELARSQPISKITAGPLASSARDLSVSSRKDGGR